MGGGGQGLDYTILFYTIGYYTLLSIHCILYYTIFGMVSSEHGGPGPGRDRCAEGGQLGAQAADFRVQGALLVAHGHADA